MKASQILFFTIFFLIYGGVNLYAFMKANAAFQFGPGVTATLVVFVLVMTLAPFLVFFSERQGLEFTARFIAYTGYIWMGILFLFVSVSFVIDIYRLILFSVGFIYQREMASIAPSAGFSFFAPLVLSISLAIYGYFDANNIRTERVTIITPKIPKDAGKVTIAQVSDVHLGLIVREGRLKNILDEVKKANPDLLVSTGDLFDGQLDQLDGIFELFSDINPRYGKFAITGNHEFYAGLDRTLGFTRRAGFTILRGEGLTAGGVVNIAGVDDPAEGFVESRISDTELLSRLPRDRFTIFLKHRPVVDKGTLGLFDLQLSGHTHRGQVFPFTLIVRMFYPRDAGWYPLPNNSFLYVSRGSGTWGPPIRFLSPPEVTVIELVHSEKGS